MSAQTVGTPAPQEVPARRPFLRLVRAPKQKAKTVPFVLLVVGLLGLALVSLLVLNTQRAQLSFRAATLQQRVADLQDQQQQLQRDVETDQDPATLASRAAALGMVPETDPGFLGADGQVVGAVPSGAPVPTPGATGKGGIVVAGDSAAPKAAAAAPPKTAAPAASAPAASAPPAHAAATAAPSPTPTASPSPARVTSPTAANPSTRSSR